MFISTVLDVAFAFSVFGFLAMHITLVLSNTTTIEMYEKKRLTPWRCVVLVSHATPRNPPVARPRRGRTQCDRSKQMGTPYTVRGYCSVHSLCAWTANAVRTC